MAKIAVLGASSSLMEDGWLDFFAKFFPDEYEIASFSLPSAGSLYGAYAIERYPEIADYDFCVVDYAIYDQQLLDGGYASAEMLASSFYSLMAGIRTRMRACRPLAMILPQRDLLNSDADRVRRMQRAICTHLKVPFLDVGSILEHRIRFCGETPDSFFVDWAHLNVPAAQKIAQIMERVFRAEPVEDEPLPPNADKLMKRYPPIDAARVEAAELEVVSMSSPVLEMECDALKDGDEMRLGAVPYLCGLVNWTDEETGDASVEAVNDAFVKSLRRDEGGEFVLTVFETPVYGLHGATIRFGATPGFARQRAHELSEEPPAPGARILIGDVVTCDGNPKANGAQILATVEGGDTSRFDIALHNALFSEDFAP